MRPQASTVRHASFDGERTLCGRYCGFHRPLAYVKPIEGWAQRVNCQACRKTADFTEETTR